MSVRFNYLSKIAIAAETTKRYNIKICVKMPHDEFGVRVEHIN